MTAFRKSRVVSLPILVTLVGGHAADVRAQATVETADAGLRNDTSDATSLARDAFKQGTALARDGHWSDALAAFERSAELHPHAVTTYNLGYCERGLGRLTRARQLFVKALLDDQRSGGGELPKHLVVQAEDYLAELDRTLARVAVLLTPPEASVSVDGAPLEKVAASPGRPLWVAGTRTAAPPEMVGMATFDVLLDPGAHKFVVTGPGYQDTIIERTVGTGERSNLELRATSSRIDFAVRDEGPSSSYRVPMYAAFGVGGLGLAVGITAGIIAVNKQSQLGTLCRDMTCYGGEGNTTLQTARTSADVSTIGFAVGAGGAAAGALLWLLGRGGAAKQHSAIAGR